MHLPRLRVIIKRTVLAQKCPGRHGTGLYDSQVGTSHNMIASRIYRPTTHTVYNRYHVLFDSDVVYGDFMGNMYKKRVDADKMLRDYYNTEVNELLNCNVRRSQMDDRKR